MQDQKVTEPTNTNPKPAEQAVPAVAKAAQGDYVKKIADKIRTSENILVALSRNPSVDDMAAALGLALYLDEMQKHTTAIYSGQTPDALAFLKPDETFEKDTASLQDFIIAISKDKADHLRYKLEGDFVKVYITPYKTTIDEQDLAFSHGDYNVDFVVALNVPSAADLDEALSEHGRIMHDASTVDITTGAPGKFGEIEWSNPGASSVCEMVAELIFALQGSDEKPLSQDIATALLTGIVAATERFSNNRTTSETMNLASKLMSMGADQQLIAANVMDNGGGMMGNPAVQAAPEVAPETEPVVAPETVMTEINQVPPEDVIVQPVIPTPAAEAAAATPVVEEGPKDYAAMLQQALAEPSPGLPGEPVPNPMTNTVLPPPPTSQAGPEMMPPVLPPVQTPPDMA